MHALRDLNMDRNQDLYVYVKSLMEERQQTLQELETQHRHGRLAPGNYSTCKKALLTALEELQRLLRSIEEAEFSSL